MLGHVVTKTNRQRHQAVIQPCRVDMTLWGILSLLLFYYHLRRQVYVKVLTKHHGHTGTGLFYKATGTDTWRRFAGSVERYFNKFDKDSETKNQKRFDFSTCWHSGTFLFLVIWFLILLVFSQPKGLRAVVLYSGKLHIQCMRGWLIGAAHLNVKACQPPWTGMNDKCCIFQGAWAYSWWHNTDL